MEKVAQLARYVVSQRLPFGNYPSARYQKNSEAVDILVILHFLSLR